MNKEKSKKVVNDISKALAKYLKYSRQIQESDQYDTID